MKDWLFARVPALEVATRLAYWRIEPLRKIGDAVRKGLVSRVRPAAAETARPVAFDRVLDAIRNLGVGEGDILIVHSSYNALRPTGLSPERIVDGLRGLVGSSGTLAMPAIPIIRGEPQGDAKFDDAAYEKVFEYDPRSTRIATGALPKTLMGLPGATHSLHPGNSMTAIGPAADAMMRDNLAGEKLSACGPGSSWAYAYRNDAKIIAIGIDLVHSLTMIHVAEEAFADQWPIRDWYRERRFVIRDGQGARPVTIRERKHSWSQFYAERAFSRDLYRNSIASTEVVDGLAIHGCSSRELVDFLLNHPRPAYPYVFPLGLPRTKGA